jgi:hypothetical protein
VAVRYMIEVGALAEERFSAEELAAMERFAAAVNLSEAPAPSLQLSCRRYGGHSIRFDAAQVRSGQYRVRRR